MNTTKRIVMLAAAGAAALALSGAVAGAADQVNDPLSKQYRVTRAKDVEFQKVDSAKVFDNLYYVGPGYVAVWLLTTPQGDILFDTAQEPYTDWVLGNIKKYVNPRDIKYIVINHGHIDHFGGAARMQELTGARVIAIAEERARQFREEHTQRADTYDAFKQMMDGRPGFVIAPWCGAADCEAQIKTETQATIRNMPIGGSAPAGGCVRCGRPAVAEAWFAKAY